MTPIEELLQATLDDAASRVTPGRDLAEPSRRRARRIRSQRRGAALAVIAACAAAIVTVASLVVGPTEQRSAPPVGSQSPSPTASTSLSIDGSQSTVSMLLRLQRLGVLDASGTNIYDGNRVIRLTPQPTGAAGIRSLLRLPGHGFVVDIANAQMSGIAVVTNKGKLRYLLQDHSTAYTRPSAIAVSSDGNTIAYGQFVGSKTRIRLVTPAGSLIAQRLVPGFYGPVAVSASQVWLRTAADGTTLEPVVWDRRTGRTTTLDVGNQTDVTAVDLVGGYAALYAGPCALVLVKVTAPTHIVAQSCKQEAMAFAPGGWLLASTRGRTLVRLRIPDLKVVWTANVSTFPLDARGWTPDGGPVGVTFDGAVVSVDAASGAVTKTQGAGIDDASLTLADSWS